MFVYYMPQPIVTFLKLFDLPLQTLVTGAVATVGIALLPVIALLPRKSMGDRSVHPEDVKASMKHNPHACSS